MSNGKAEKRAALDAWIAERGSVDQLAAAHPHCSCEIAVAAPGGHGPVEDSESLRLFIASRFQHDLKRPKKNGWGPHRLQKIFTSGLSVIRITRADSREIEYTARLLYENAIENDPEYGGIVGVVDFPASKVRELIHREERALCVLDTPLDRIESGGFLRPSHADVVQSGVVIDEAERIIVRTNFYNDIQGQRYTVAADVQDCDLAPFIPACGIG